ncbi:MAG: signal recognition particle-docking protein FtsY [Myxococcota bacterium]|nr:signal recognition particle-docking protein FtsY [Myxococcota bacterium]
MIVTGIFSLLFLWLVITALRRTHEEKKKLYAEVDESTEEHPLDGLKAEGATSDGTFGHEPGEADVSDTRRDEFDGQVGGEEVAAVSLVAEPRIEVAGEFEVQPEDETKAEVKPLPQVDEALRGGLAKTRTSLLGRIASLLGAGKKVDDSVLDELEEVLLTSDVGVKLTMVLVDALRDGVQSRALKDAESVRSMLKEKLRDALDIGDLPDNPLALGEINSKVILFVGVNGVGKTTTIGKIAALLKEDGRSVVLGAGDTFRAAAVEQLKVWGERTSCPVIAGDEGSDPASVIFKAVEKGVSDGADFILADTAGRLHTKSELMDEIKKVARAAGKAQAGSPHEVWLVVDGTSGQNALIQARQFNETLGLTGIILTKLDGTAKGGVVFSISHELNIPVRFVGVGEKSSDLRPFHRDAFIDALFEDAA